MCVCAHAHAHACVYVCTCPSMQMKVRGQLLGVGSLTLPCMFQGLNSVYSGDICKNNLRKNSLV